MMSGQAVPNRRVKVEISIPEPIAEAIARAAEKTGIEQQVLFDQIAGVSFQDSIKDIISSKGKTAQEDPLKEAKEELKALGFDMTTLQNQFSELQGMISQMNKFKDVFQNAATGLGTSIPTGPGKTNTP